MNELLLEIPLNSNIFILSGAGISKESGIQTFRDSDGLWNNHRIEDVASPEGFYKGAFSSIYFRIDFAPPKTA